LADKRVAIIGAGIGGLAAAVLLGARGCRVTLLERTGQPGGKMRTETLAGRQLDVGPTVLTLPWIFEEIFEAAGASLNSAVRLTPLEVLARHAWSEGERLDLFAAPARSAEAIGHFAGPEEARGYLRFCARAALIYRTLERPFMLAPRPSLPGLMAASGLRGMPDLCRINPYVSLWRALGGYFRDPRLRQVFGRYSTYAGSSPMRAPATLMLIAHVEQSGVWNVEGGMAALAGAMARLAEGCGVTVRYGADVAGIEVARGRACGVRLACGERLAADAVIANADSAALAAGHFGEAVRAAVRPVRPAERSLSAVTFAMVAEAAGFPLTRHNVFFSRDYPAEFVDLIDRKRLPRDPTVYLCAADRADAAGAEPGAPERLLCVVNAPPTGDTRAFQEAEIRQCEESTFGTLARCGLRIAASPTAMRITTPHDFNRLYPATGGALYGRASHGWTASFSRPGARSRIPGLYLTGGSTHPGAGVPMAAISGRLAAASLLADLASTARSRGTVMLGGMSTPSATMDNTPLR